MLEQVLHLRSTMKSRFIHLGIFLFCVLYCMCYVFIYKLYQRNVFEFRDRVMLGLSIQKMM